MSQDEHQSRDQPSRHDLDALNVTLLDPVEKLVRLLKQASRRHRALGAAVPSPISLLLLDCLLKHGPKPTISASRRGSGSSRPHRIAESSPASRRGNKVHLAIECPL